MEQTSAPTRTAGAAASKEPWLKAVIGETQASRSFLKTDDDRIINEARIIWAKRANDCMYACMKTVGCGPGAGDAHKICKAVNEESYNRLNKHFE